MPQDIKLADRSMVWNTDLIEALELENLLINAAITMHSAEQVGGREGGLQRTTGGQALVRSVATGVS